jgi:hypothetical protein
MQAFAPLSGFNAWAGLAAAVSATINRTRKRMDESQNDDGAFRAAVG